MSRKFWIWAGIELGSDQVSGKVYTDENIAHAMKTWIIIERRNHVFVNWTY